MKPIKTIFIIGSGQLGSRHLQALKKVRFPLDIKVIDPNKNNLATAHHRWLEVKTPNNHRLEFLEKTPTQKKNIDLAIIATNSNTRAEVIKELVYYHKVKYLILEKILFQKKSDYINIGKLLSKNKIKTWINCPMRTLPFHKKIKEHSKSNITSYTVSASSYGLMCNLIHYIDHLAYLTNCQEFSVNTDLLQPKLIKSKRPGFLEMTGTIQIKFKNNCHANIIFMEKSDAPVQIFIFNPNFYCLINETQSKAIISESKSNWKERIVPAPIPFQSERTTNLVNDLLNKGVCPLTPYQESTHLHLQLFEPILKFIKKNINKKYNYYPFT